MQQRYQFCPYCGGKLYVERKAERPRLTCQSCGRILYENPIVGVAAVVRNAEGKILLGKRSETASYAGLWCIPCGYVEYDEEVRQAVCREFYEETGLEIVVKKVFAVLSNFHNPLVHTVGIWFESEIVSGCLEAGDDLSEVGYFALHEVPPLAFPTDQIVLDMLKSEQEKIQPLIK
ncbi:ADP-ribose pyrophosphatase YjhB (NUDIX family) [Sporomusaceae bacterium BoRhaA]|uniref:NUDIX hydrolase n=1 Tax=Pelorhabdus rhamnosifermentans TaxID=2772457 RepID=UPI001C0638F5|nr:NUDIX hydrolase [Pelorhabdus rhamnosifermentans]MBU2701599.1 ADP-ribose pyrophosphatase YjhB (NUDIX family) [Pelorhabdus rhamnosifermentans]